MAKIVVALACVCLAVEAKILRAERQAPLANMDKEFAELDAELAKLDKAVEDLAKGGDEKKVKGIKGMVKNAKEYYKKNRDDNIAQVGKAAASVVTAIQTISNTDDPFKVAQAITGTVAEFSALIPPPAGIAISTVLSVASAILGLGAKRTPTMGEVVDAAIKKGLDKQHIKELREEVRGTKMVLTQNLEILQLYSEKISSAEWHNSTDSRRQNDILFLGQQIKLQEGLPLLGKLEFYVEDEIASVVPANPDDSDRITPYKVKKNLGLVRCYSEVSGLRLSLLHYMRAIYALSGTNEIADDAIETVYQLSQRHAANFLKFMVYPDHLSVTFTSGYSSLPSDSIFNFTKSVGLEDRRSLLPKGNFKLRTTEYGSRPSDERYFCSWGMTRQSDAPLLKLENQANGTTICTPDGKQCACQSGMWVRLRDMPCSNPYFNVVPFGEGVDMGTIDRKKWKYYIVPVDRPGNPMTADEVDYDVKLYDYANDGSEAYWALEEV